MTKKRERKNATSKQACQSLLPIGQGHTGMRARKHRLPATRAYAYAHGPSQALLAVPPLACGRVGDLLEQEQGSLCLLCDRSAPIFHLFSIKKTKKTFSLKTAHCASPPDSFILASRCAGTLRFLPSNLGRLSHLEAPLIYLLLSRLVE